MIPKWCSHTEFRPSHSGQKDWWFYSEAGFEQAIIDNWTFCPICGAKRPEEKRKLLADILSDITAEKGWIIGTNNIWGQQAKAAIDVVIEVYNRWEKGGEDVDWSFPAYLRKELMGEK